MQEIVLLGAVRRSVWKTIRVQVPSIDRREQMTELSNIIKRTKWNISSQFDMPIAIYDRRVHVNGDDILKIIEAAEKTIPDD